MKITIVIDDNEAPDLEDIRQSIAQFSEDLMTTAAEFANRLDALNAQIVKVKGEIDADIDALKAAIGNAGIDDPAVQAAFKKVETTLQQFDDENPDAKTVA